MSRLVLALAAVAFAAAPVFAGKVEISVREDGCG